MNRSSHLRVWAPLAALLVFSAFVSVFAADSSKPQAAASTERRRVKVLFLGDEGHHQPLLRARDIFTVLARRGIDLTYTDRLEDLNPSNLARYDCLMVYANIDKVGADQEQAILAYVSTGHGFVPIHCASACFGGQPKLVSLMGGRFKSHGTGTFKETFVSPDHPILKGLKPIENWDETYVHSDHNEADRKVLSVRVEGEVKEPNTWIRTPGKGRVFYTAWGHDERTWTNADFQNLIERGLRWAAGDWAMDLKDPLKPFEYTKANLPNYIPNKPWGTMGDPINTMQQPVSPAESVKHIVVPPGFSAKLFASEPQIKKPICMTWDARGRLWVAETFDYPNDMQPQGKGNDQIKICQDTDGDGVADKFTVFADKLSIPTSILPIRNGVIVMQAPHTLLLDDTDGDGVADKRTILFTGWGTSDTHAGPSNLRWGFDGWVYGCVGYSGFRGKVAGQEIGFGAGAYRFKPDGSKMEFLGSTNNNTWGFCFSEDNNIFLSTANNNPSDCLGIPNRYYEPVRGLSPKGAMPLADTYKFYPITDKVRQMDGHGGYTAAAGHALYTARTYPSEYWNRAAFVTEPTGHVVGRFDIIPTGAGFRSQNHFNFLGSDDEWTSPVAAEVGPDGAVWVIDWYNYVIQHNPIPTGFVQGKGNAYVTPLRDKVHGRVYRIEYDGTKLQSAVDLALATGPQRVAALKNDNMFWRMTAQQLLVASQELSLLPALLDVLKDSSVDSTGLNAGAVHALWTLHGLGLAKDPRVVPEVIRAMNHPSPAVRRAALDVIPRTAEAIDAILKGRLLEDKDPQVRKTALLTLSEMPQSDATGAAVFQILSRKDNAEDPWLADASAIAAARHDAGFLRSVFAAHPAANSANPVTRSAQVNLLPNPSFELGQGDRCEGWEPRGYGGIADHKRVKAGRTGDWCLQIHSDAGSDTTWFTEVKVDPNSDYRLSGWVKTDNVRNVQAGRGALFNIHEVQPAGKTSAVADSSADWRRLEVTFNTGPRDRIMVNCLFGGWGRSAGTAWYDDVELTKTSAPGLPGAEGRVIGIVCNQYASRGPVDSIVATLESMKNSDPALASLVIDSLASGWPEGKTPKFSQADGEALQSVIAALPEAARDRMLVLADRWGRTDLFTAQSAAVMESLSAKLSDVKLNPDDRIAAARKVMQVDPSANAVKAVLKQLTPQMPPDLQAGLVESIGESRSAEAGSLLLARWSSIAPAAQRTGISLLLRREGWSAALLDAIEKGTVSNRDLAPQHWQALASLSDKQLVDRANKLRQASGRAPTADRKAMIDGMLPLADKQGKAELGKAVFTKNCAVCHTLEGTGGKVGPELTGVGAKPRRDILQDIIDPNRSVEGTYRQWIVKTKREVLSGRLLSESRTSIDLIDTAGKVHTVQRDEIAALKQSDVSVMPEGFEALPAEDLQNLMELLAQSRVKH